MQVFVKAPRPGIFSGIHLPSQWITKARSITPAQATTGLLAAWILALSGIFSDALHTPGILQAMRLRALLGDKRAQIARLQDEVRNLKVEIGMMESSSVVQQREVRRVLGYAAPDELIFDFSAPERLE